MSIRAKLVRFTLRHTMKRKFADIGISQVHVDKFRNYMKKTEKFSAKIPTTVNVESIEISGVPCEWIDKRDTPQKPNSDQRVLVYLHGGGYVCGGPDSHRDLAWRIAEQSRCRLLLVDYRLAPEHRFPAAIDDASSCYQNLLDKGYQPDNIAFAGDSAGGGLVAATFLKLKELKLPQPKCAVLMSPWLDLAASGDSIIVNEQADPMLTPKALKTMSTLYLGDVDVRTPMASPVFSDTSALAPMLIHVGSTEILLSDAERFSEAIEKNGGVVSLKVWPKMPHVFQVFAALMPEAKRSIEEISEFITAHLYSAQP